MQRKPQALVAIFAIFSLLFTACTVSAPSDARAQTSPAFCIYRAQGSSTRADAPQASLAIDGQTVNVWYSAASASIFSSGLFPPTAAFLGYFKPSDGGLLVVTTVGNFGMIFDWDTLKFLLLDHGEVSITPATCGAASVALTATYTDLADGITLTVNGTLVPRRRY